MRKKKEEPRIIEEKGFISEDESVMNLSACLNRIYRKVSSEGLTNDSLQELRNDIDYVAAFYHIDTPSSVLLAGILEKSATNNLMDDEDLANYLGCTKIEFIHYHEQLLNMDKAGIIQMGGGRGPRHCYRVTPETLKAVEAPAFRSLSSMLTRMTTTAC